MTGSDTQSTSDKPRERPWPATAVGLLLLLQAVMLVGLAPLLIAPVSLPQLPGAMAELSRKIPDVVVPSILFMPLAMVAILAAIGCLRLWANAWTNAMLVQGLSLATALIIYFNRKPAYVYVLMLYGIFMVLYLNYREVKMAFLPQPALEDLMDGLPYHAPGR